MRKLCECCGAVLPEFGGIVCDEDRAEIRFRGKFTRSLTQHEFRMFVILLNKAGKPVAKEAIIELLYSQRILADDEIPELKIIDVYICRLRKKLRPLGIDIGTAWGRGYFLIEPTEVVNG